MREETFKDDKMQKVLADKDVLITEGRALTAEIEELEKKRNKIGLKVQKLKDKMVAMIDKKTFELGEFEYLRSVELKGDDIVVTVQDANLDWQEAYREQKKEAEKS